jgi:hypothetical protein
MIYYIKDNNGHRWKVREAVSIKAAINEISHARATGSIGGKSIIDETLCGGTRKVLADVVRVHSDFTEQKSYEELR